MPGLDITGNKSLKKRSRGFRQKEAEKDAAGDKVFSRYEDVEGRNESDIIIVINVSRPPPTLLSSPSVCSSLSVQV